MRKRANSSTRPVLIIQHAESEHPASLCRAMESQHIPSIRVHPYLGENYPDISEISGILSLGGPMGAKDEQEHPWIRVECELLRQSAEKGLPTVGICLGAQMLARALGGEVERNPHPEVGWFPVELTEEGKKDPLAGAAGPSPTVYHWHADTFHLPPGAELLGHSKACERQAFRLTERVYGFQFHPEADNSLVKEWLAFEGVPEDIEKILNAHGASSVQGAEAQLRHAPRVEQESLRISAAISTIFRAGELRPAEPATKKLREDLGRWRDERAELALELKLSGGKALVLKGTIQTVFSIPAGDFAIFLDQSTGFPWPIAVADIRKIRKIGSARAQR